MNSREYWIKRAQHREAVSWSNGLEASAALIRVYKQTSTEIRRDINDFYMRYAGENGKYSAAICAGPTVLADLGIPDGKNATCYPGCEGQMGSANMVPGAAAVTDGKLITGTSAGCAIPFGLALIAALKGQEAADAIAAQIVIR